MFGRNKNSSSGDRSGGNLGSGALGSGTSGHLNKGTSNASANNNPSQPQNANRSPTFSHNQTSFGGANMSREHSHTDTNSRDSEGGSHVSSVFTTSTHHHAPSTLGGATSITGGMEMLGSGKSKDNHNEYAHPFSASSANSNSNRSTNNNSSGGASKIEMDSFGDNYNNTLGNIANEMIEGKQSGISQRRDTLYEDARESVTPQPGPRPQANKAAAHAGQQQQRQSQQAQQQQASGQKAQCRSESTANRSAAGGGPSKVMSNASVDEWGSRGGAGLANASRFEQTDLASFVGQDPIAQAGDFMDEEADVVFLSSEMGTGPNRQPMTRFRIHSVNLNVHSPVLSEMVDEQSDEGGEIRLEEDAATLKLLFGLLYNRSAPALGMNEWQVVLRLARCAQKYDVSRAKEVAAAYFTEQEQLGALSPFMTYAFAVQYKLPALEEAAAERSTRYDLQRLPELVFNMMGFSAFQSLATFHSRRQAHYQDVLNNIAIDPKELADQCYQTGGVCVVSPLSRLKNKLAWPRQSGRDGSKRPPEPADVLRKLTTEIGQIDCGTCAKALVEGALQVQLALESLPSYNDTEDAF